MISTPPFISPSPHPVLRAHFHFFGTLLFFILSMTGSSLRAQIYADVSVSQGTTPLGTFRILLEHQKAPRTVANFIGLATGQRKWVNPRTGAVQIGKPYYDGLIFHRLIHDFMIQGGDPLGNGTGGPGYVFQDEFDPSLSHSDAYIVSMANSGANSNGSQFFITLSAPTHLDQKHAIFGLVINDATYPNSRALIDSFKNSTAYQTNASNLPNTPITITSITVSGPDLAAFDLEAPEYRLPYVNGKTITLRHDSVTSSSALQWEARDSFDYPVYYSTNLETWSKPGSILSMEDNPAYSIDITTLTATPASFYTVVEIDYREVPQAPQDLLTAGSQLTLQPYGGSLILSFNGSSGGSWQFVYDNVNIPTESGNISSASQTNNATYPTIPLTGTYLNNSGTYARNLSLRQITVFLDGPAGPDLLTAVQPLLSFHSNGAGWFEGAVNSDSTEPVTFKGAFSYSEAP